MYNSILLPVDPDEPHIAALSLARAKRLVVEDGAVLRLVSVVTHVASYAVEYLRPDFDTRIIADARAKLERVGADLDLPDERVSASVRSGRVYHEVLEEARSFNADLIVIASRNPGTHAYLIGSNVASIVRHAECSVLVVRE